MDCHRAYLGTVGTLAVIGLLAGLTIHVMITEGIDILVVSSLLILGLFSFGILGALTQKSDE